MGKQKERPNGRSFCIKLLLRFKFQNSKIHLHNIKITVVVKSIIKRNTNIFCARRDLGWCFSIFPVVNNSNVGILRHISTDELFVFIIKRAVGIRAILGRHRAEFGYRASFRNLYEIRYEFGCPRGIDQTTVFSAQIFTAVCIEINYGIFSIPVGRYLSIHESISRRHSVDTR